MLAFGAKKAGMQGKGTTLAVSPSRSGGAFSEHMDKMMDLQLSEMGEHHCNLDLPSFDRSLGRVCKPYDALVVHHPLSAEVAGHGFEQKLSEQVSNGILGPSLEYPSCGSSSKCRRLDRAGSSVC